MLDQYLDRSSTRRTPTSYSSEFLNTYINSNLFDIWRIFNTTGREFSLCSHVRIVYTRIDNFLVYAKLLPDTCNVRYPFSLRLGDIVPNARVWRLNPQLLTEPTFSEHLKDQITFSFDTNDNTDFPNIIVGNTEGLFERLYHLLSGWQE